MATLTLYRFDDYMSSLWSESPVASYSTEGARQVASDNSINVDILATKTGFSREDICLLVTGLRAQLGCSVDRAVEVMRDAVERGRFSIEGAATRVAALKARGDVPEIVL